ncbi:MAG: phosphoribosylformylglycinamidine synthase subunit PurQ [Planctomycetaceae bacterium]
MPKPKICVLRAPGTNCDHETAFAFDQCGGEAEPMHVFRLLERPERLRDFQILCIPGGFSYGDDIGAGVIFGGQMRSHLAEAIGEFVQADKLVLGICNGFQVLLKAGLLPHGAAGWPPKSPPEPEATLTWNQNGRYTSVWVKLHVGSEKCVFLRGIDEIELPVAHAEGRIAVRDHAVIYQWEQNRQVALTYQPRRFANASSMALAGAGVVGVGAAEESAAAGRELLAYPDNPNGSVANIAGLCDATGRVLGLMPHPERFLFATQHPQWTRKNLTGEGEGMAIFRNAVRYFE